MTLSFPESSQETARIKIARKSADLAIREIDFMFGRGLNEPMYYTKESFPIGGRIVFPHGNEPSTRKMSVAKSFGTCKGAGRRPHPHDGLRAGN